jgi:membrane protein YdbS with pleckstrin-like domain
MPPSLDSEQHNYETDNSPKRGKTSKRDWRWLAVAVILAFVLVYLSGGSFLDQPVAFVLAVAVVLIICTISALSNAIFPR